MSTLFASGRIIDLILALTAAEGVCIVWYRRLTGRGPPAMECLSNLLSGLALLLALRLALTGTWWGWLALCLLASLAAHFADLRMRWR